MRFALIAVVILTFVGCAVEGPRQVPTAPSPAVATAPSPPVPTSREPPPLPLPPPPARPPVLTYVWVLVLEGGRSGPCVPEARVEIVRGQSLGRSLTQSVVGCESWDPEYGAWEPYYGATFDGLNVGEELTFRASAPGYTAKEITIVPTPDGESSTTIVLSKIQ